MIKSFMPSLFSCPADCAPPKRVHMSCIGARLFQEDNLFKKINSYKKPNAFMKFSHGIRGFRGTRTNDSEDLYYEYTSP